MVNVKKWLIVIGIAIILSLFVGYGINLFLKEPQYDKYCDSFYGPKYVPDGKTDPGANQTLCNQTEGARWEMTYCNFTYECNKKYNDALEFYNKNVFFISVAIGIILLIASMFVVKQEAVSTGLLGGSILLIIYGVVRYWYHAADWLRFAILGIALATLIWVAYTKMNK